MSTEQTFVTGLIRVVDFQEISTAFWIQRLHIELEEIKNDVRTRSSSYQPALLDDLCVCCFSITWFG